MPKIGALAIAKAHPLVFGAVLAVAIGIVVYQLVKPKKQKKLKYSNSSGRPDSGDGDAGPEGIFYYDPETKSVTNTPPSSNPSNSDLRKRHGTRNTPSTSNKNSGRAPHEKKESISKEVRTESVDNNQNIDDNKVLPDKNLDSAMSLDEKVNKYFLRNIPETDSIISDGESDSTNDFSKPDHKCCCDCECHTVDTSSTCDSESSSWSNISCSDVKKKNLSAPSICSVTSIESESSLGTILSGDSELCRGCEQNPVNTHTQPCNHRYMCSDCALRIFRLFKRCKVCRARIERIVVEE